MTFHLLALQTPETSFFLHRVQCYPTHSPNSGNRNGSTVWSRNMAKGLTPNSRAAAYPAKQEVEIFPLTKQTGDKHWLKHVQDHSKYCITNLFCAEFPSHVMVPLQIILAERDEAAQRQVEKCFCKHCGR